MLWIFGILDSLRLVHCLKSGLGLLKFAWMLAIFLDSASFRNITSTSSTSVVLAQLVSKFHLFGHCCLDQLMICLRQNTEELKIDYSFGVLNIVRDLEQRRSVLCIVSSILHFRIEVNRDVKSLKVCGWIDRVSDILTIMRAIFPALPNLSTAEIDPGRRWKRVGS